MIESLEPNGTLERSSTEQEDFSQLQEWLPDNEASYTIYFLDTPPENYIFISYVPDTSNVPLPLSITPLPLLYSLIWDVGPIKDVIRVQSSNINLNTRSPRSTSRPSNHRNLKIKPNFPRPHSRLPPLPLQPLPPRKRNGRN